MAGIYREVWTGELIKFLTASDNDSFLQGIPDYSQYVTPVGDEMMVIHIADMDVLPEVLINNTTYPIPLQDIGINDIPIALDKYQTKVTPITHDEMYAASVKKMQALVGKHGLAIQIMRTKKAIHALAPSGNTAKMPVLVTTGADDGTGRLRCTWEDVSRLKEGFDNNEIPEDGRRLVLSSDHENDLCRLDQKFKDQYYNRTTGKPYNQLGFEFAGYVSNPWYNPSTKAKLSFGAVPASTDRRATVAFSIYRAAKADGITLPYFSAASTDPTMQRSLMSSRHYRIVLPTKEEARGAIVSGNA